MSKFSLGWYMFALCGGLASGLCFSRAQYHKGQRDAYADIVEILEGVHQQHLDEYLENKEEESR